MTDQPINQRTAQPSDPTVSLVPTRKRRDGAGARVGGGESATVIANWTVQPAGDEAPTAAADPGVTRGNMEEAGLCAGEAPRGPVYKLLRPVGRGGMGEVWEARQESLRRLVAVKTIRAESWVRLAQDPVERVEHRLAFEQEAFIAGRLDHPNIVPVYDLGSSGGDGPPLLAMKLVTGDSWADLLSNDFANLSAEAVLAKHLPILHSVAQAVAFAHSRGIVHRDLKPGQVMIGAFGETLLTDWGLGVYVGADAGGAARRRSEMEPEVDLPTPATATSPAGTPVMMAPEQAVDTAEGIGTWTDVYLLGGTLYFILTGGSYPHTATVAMPAIERAKIGEIEPPGRRAPKRFIPAELEELCLRALAKSPGERVPSVQVFLELLSDYMTGAGRRRESEAVAAQAEKSFHELFESARAGRTAPFERYVQHGAVEQQVAKALELWPGNARARSLREKNLASRLVAEIEQGDLLLARVHLQELRGISPAGATGLEEKLDAAEKRRAAHRRQRVVFGTAAAVLFLCAIGFALVSRANATRAQRNLAIAEKQGEGSQQLVLYVLDELKDQMEDQLTAERGLTIPVANEIKHAIGDAVGGRVADYYRGLDYKEWPAELKLELAEQLEKTAIRFYELNVFDDAQGLLEAAAGIRRELGGAETSGMATTLNYLARIHRSRGEYAEARRLCLQALAIREKVLGPNHKDVAASLSELAVIERRLENLDKAEELILRVIAIHESDKEVSAGERSAAYDNLAATLKEKGDLARAEELYLTAIELAKKDDGGMTLRASNSINNLALLYSAQQKYDKALPLLEETLAIQKREFGMNSPGVSATLINLADTKIHLGRLDEAEEHIRGAVSLREAAFGPESSETALALNTMAVIVHDLGKVEEATKIHERVLAIREKVFGRNHVATATTLSNIGSLFYEQGKYGDAEEKFREAREIIEGLRGPLDTSLLPIVANHGAALEKLGDLEGALKCLRQALEICEKAPGMDPKATEKRRLALAGLLERMGRSEEAEEFKKMSEIGTK